MNKPFKILSIDGGGIKGLYSAKILQHLEEVHKCNISDHFDLLCGTSTGGIIALALSLKIPAKTVSDLYEKKGKKIFPRYRKILWTGKLRQTLMWGKYSKNPLKKALTELFKTATIGESNNLLCIPTFSITDSRNVVIKWNHGKLSRDNVASYVEVALATSAAPTYFPLAEIKTETLRGKQFIDGGVWSNNPSIVALSEALQYFVGEGKEYDSLEMLSISSLNHTGGMNPGKRKNRSFWGWKDELFNIILRGQSDNADWLMRQLSNSTATKFPFKYVRIPSEGLSAEQSTTIDLDNASKKAIKLLVTKGNDRGLTASKEDPIVEFFKTKKIHKTK